MACGLITFSPEGIINGAKTGVGFTSPTITIAGGVAPYTLAITGGILPYGLVLPATTTPAGTFEITGAPIISGDFIFQITATDSSGEGCTGTGDYSMGIPASETCKYTSFAHVAQVFIPTFNTFDLAIFTPDNPFPHAFDITGFDFTTGTVASLQALINALPFLDANNKVTVSGTMSASGFDLNFNFFFTRQGCEPEVLDFAGVQLDYDGTSSLVLEEPQPNCDCRVRKKSVGIGGFAYFKQEICVKRIRDAKGNLIKCPDKINPYGRQIYTKISEDNVKCCYRKGDLPKK